VNDILAELRVYGKSERWKLVKKIRDWAQREGFAVVEEKAQKVINRIESELMRIL